MSDNNIIIVEMLRDSGIYTVASDHYAFPIDQAHRLIAAGVARPVNPVVEPSRETAIAIAASAKTSGPRRRVMKG